MRKDRLLKVMISGGTGVLIFCLSLFYLNWHNSRAVVLKSETSDQNGVFVDASIDNCNEEEMYKKYVQTLLEQRLYNSRDAYDTCHYLMVPMYYAFQCQNDVYLDMFQTHMEGLAALSEQEIAEFRELSMLDRLHYLYFITEYMCLCVENNESVSDGLFSFVYQEIVNITETYTGAWKSVIDYSNIWELLEGVLTGEGYANDKSYSNVITDLDFFPLAVLCDLKTVYEQSNMEAYADIKLFS